MVAGARGGDGVKRALPVLLSCVVLWSSGPIGVEITAPKMEMEFRVVACEGALSTDRWAGVPSKGQALRVQRRLILLEWPSLPWRTEMELPWGALPAPQKGD